MITLSRQKKLKDATRAFKVYIDGEGITKIKNNQTINLDLNEGMHTIKLRLDWCSSNTYSFDYTKNKTIHFICYPSSSNKFKEMIFNRNSYIVLLCE